MLHINTDERKKTKNNVKLEIVVKQISKLNNSTILAELLARAKRSTMGKKIW